MLIFSLAVLFPFHNLGNIAAYAAANDNKYATLTLGEVQAQITAFQSQNATLYPLPTRQFDCALACSFLALSQPGKVSFPGSPDYHFQESGYWSQQQASTQPACRLTPTCAKDVSLAVLTSRITRCEFAVKSGGHAAFAGASNIEGGLAIDLRELNEITVSADHTQTVVGAGNIWYDVYTKLQPLGLAVIGGRVSAIGVGGLTLGGGISFFSNRHGWACDNVDSYEVVFADGTIHMISYKSPYSDLYWALRGGGNNFGIVTSFTLTTYPQGSLWAGSQTFLYTEETAAAINDAFESFTVHSPEDPYAQIIIAYAYAQTQGVYIIASDLQHGQPRSYPSILKNFTSIPGPVSDTLRITDLANLTLEFNNTNPSGFRQTYWTLTVKNNAKLMSDMVAIYMDQVEAVKDAAGIVPSLVFQPISTSMTEHFTKHGGNPLGLAGQGPLNLINVDISWSNATDDRRILNAAQNMINQFKKAASAQSLDHPYLYQNYASLQQDVFPSYGAANLDRLKAVQAKYDPNRLWQKLQPGYFKLR